MTRRHRTREQVSFIGDENGAETANKLNAPYTSDVKDER